MISNCWTAPYCTLLRSETSPAERLRAAIAMTRAVRALAEAGIRKRHAGASDEEIVAKAVLSSLQVERWTSLPVGGNMIT